MNKNFAIHTNHVKNRLLYALTTHLTHHHDIPSPKTIKYLSFFFFVTAEITNQLYLFTHSYALLHPKVQCEGMLFVQGWIFVWFVIFFSFNSIAKKKLFFICFSSINHLNKYWKPWHFPRKIFFFVKKILRHRTSSDKNKTNTNENYGH